jgi:hypothetical protein
LGAVTNPSSDIVMSRTTWLFASILVGFVRWAQGLINTSQQIGGGIGLAILTTVSTTRTNNLLANGVAGPTALTDGFRLAFWVGVGLAVIAVVTTFVALKGEELVPQAQPAEEADNEQIAA